MSQEEELRFTELVTRQLSSEEDAVRSLWTQIAEEFNRDGPEAAHEYLDAERQRLEERVQNLLDEFERR